jgi:hypothetical protein
MEEVHAAAASASPTPVQNGVVGASKIASSHSDSPAVRVKQIHYAYLDSVYEEDYYKAVHSEAVSYGKHFDFLIGLGGALSGGSGLGILADSRIAWICGIITACSLVLTVAKSNYDWPKKVEGAVKNIDFHSKMARSYLNLIEDMNYQRQWTDRFNEQYENLRAQRANAPAQLLPLLGIGARRDIQNQIKDRINFKQWWIPVQ